MSKPRKRKYSCLKCGAGVEKPPCQKTTETTVGHGLGGWRCLGSCRGKIKVKVELIP